MTQPTDLDVADWKFALENYVAVFDALPSFMPTDDQFDQLSTVLHLISDRDAMIEQTASMLETVAAAYVLWVHNDRNPLHDDFEPEQDNQ